MLLVQTNTICSINIVTVVKMTDGPVVQPQGSLTNLKDPKNLKAKETKEKKLAQGKNSSVIGEKS